MIGKENKFSLNLLSRYRIPIMGFATLWIMMFHLWIPILGEWGKIGLIEIYLKTIGFCGVDIFLLVSGLGLVYAIEKYDLKTFYMRRLLHVYPPFFFACFGIGFFRKWELSEIFRNVFFVNFFTENIYSYLWYVPAALLFYIFFPLYYNFFKKMKSKKIFVFMTVFVWYLLSVLSAGILRPDFYGITNRIPVFIVGIFIGWLIKNHNVIFSIRHWSFIFILLMTGGVLAYLTNFKEMYFLVPTSNCAIPNFCLALSLCFILAGTFKFLEERLKKMGKGIGLPSSLFSGTGPDTLTSI